MSDAVKPDDAVAGRKMLFAFTLPPVATTPDRADIVSTLFSIDDFISMFVVPEY